MNIIFNMKTIIKISTFIILLISITFINSEVNALLPLSGKIIIIDPGHGGKDPGTTSGKVYESEINLKISKYLETELTNININTQTVSNTILKVTNDLKITNVAKFQSSFFHLNYKFILPLHEKFINN